jgi:hypothetical protein
VHTLLGGTRDPGPWHGLPRLEAALRRLLSCRLANASALSGGLCEALRVASTLSCQKRLSFQWADGRRRGGY